jgi:hypothetical protein
MNNEINTDAIIYKTVWKKTVDPHHIQSARAIHKQMLEQNKTSVPYVTAKKKKATEEEEEEPSEESGSGEDYTTVVRKKRKKSSDPDLSVNEFYQLNDSELKKYRNRPKFKRDTKEMHLDYTLSDAEFAQGMVFLKYRQAFKPNSTLPLLDDVIATIYDNNSLVNSGALSVIRDRCTKAKAEQKADKIKGKAQAALKNLDAVIATNRADILQQDTEYWKRYMPSWMKRKRRELLLTLREIL